MATAILQSPAQPQVSKATAVWLAAYAVIALAMIAMEHDFRVSQYEGYVRPSEAIEATAGGGNAARRASSLALAGVGVALLVFGESRRARLNLALALPIAAGLGWCLISALWAIDPQMCFRRLTVLGCYLLCGLGMARSGSPSDVARFCVWLAVGSVLLGVASELALGTFRPWQAWHRFAGTLHPNAQGAYLAAGAIAAWMLADTDRDNRKLWLGCFVLLAIFVEMTKSRTSLFGLAAAVAFIALIRTSKEFKLVSGFAVAWAAAFALLLTFLAGFDPQGALLDAMLLGRKEQAESLTGRSEIWEAVNQYAGLQPWTGYGYESFWTEDHIRRIADDINFTVLSAHNGYIEVILSVGIVGLGLFLASVLVALVQTARLISRLEGREFSLLLGLLVFTLICSAMESTMVSPNCAVLFLGVSLAQLALFAPASEQARLSPLVTRRSQPA